MPHRLAKTNGKVYAAHPRRPVWRRGSHRLGRQARLAGHRLGSANRKRCRRIGHDTVIQQRCRLRMSMMAGHSRRDLDCLLETMGRLGSKCGVVE